MENLPAGSELFLDAAYAIALSAPTDQYHAQAVALAEELELRRIRMVTTRAVVLEIGNALAKLRYRQEAVRLLSSIEQDLNVEIVPVSEDLYARAWQLYREREDKEWGLTDCLSFVLMRERGVPAALTPDEHFRQAGFRVLLEGP